MITIRDFIRETDEAFVMDSWRHSQDSASTAWLAPRFSPLYAADALAKGVCKVAVASEAPDVLLGWALVRGNTLEYVYVKKAARKCRIASDLFHAFGPCVTRAATTTAPWTRLYAEQIPYLGAK